MGSIVRGDQQLCRPVYSIPCSCGPVTLSHVFQKRNKQHETKTSFLKRNVHRHGAVLTTALFNLGKKTKAPTPVRETIIPDPSYNIPIVLLGIAGLSAFEGNAVISGLTGVLGAFLAFQASRVRFRFEADALEVVIGNKQESSENAFVGGENRWKYDTFTNWEFWWPSFPVLVYFKETQTKPEGQIHFFPIIFNGKQLYNVMLERCGSTKTSGPK
eukprot:jgi/Botrbrau1/17304/Bobra.0015s0057.1